MRKKAVAEERKKTGELKKREIEDVMKRDGGERGKNEK